MKRTTLFVVLVLLIQNIFAQTTEKRIALVIGNAAYQYGGALKNPVNDANLMANTLKKLGFDVIKKLNADLKTMQMAEVDFKSKLGQYNAALFYYAGHGIQVDGINYLIPIDAKLDNKEYTRYEAFDISNINNAFMANTKNVNVMILDACRDNPFKSWERGGDRGFKKIENSSTGTIIAFATQPGATAADGTGQNGLYTQELVKQMVKSQAIEQVFKQTRIAVNNKSNGKQIPQDWSSLMADFYFTNSDVNVPAQTTITDHSITPTDAPIRDLPNVLYDVRDGKSYKTVEIGSQVWMAENLNYETESGSWCYDDNINNCAKYGRLYNYETAKNVCPEGWHLPSKTEFETLLNNFSGTGYGNFKSLEEVANSGLNIQFGGGRNSRSEYVDLSIGGSCWSSSLSSNNNGRAWLIVLSNRQKEVFLGNKTKAWGYSIRCVKDY